MSAEHGEGIPVGLSADSPVDFVGVREAAQRLGVHENTIRNWAKNGTLTPYSRVTGTRRFSREQIERMRDEMLNPKPLDVDPVPPLEVSAEQINSLNSSRSKLVEVISDAWAEYEADETAFGFAEFIASQVQDEFTLIPARVIEGVRLEMPDA